MKRAGIIFCLLLTVLGYLGAQGAGIALRSDIDVQRAIAEYIIGGKVPVTNSFVYSGNELAEILDYNERIATGTGFKSRLIFSINPAVTGVTGLDAYSDSITADPTMLYFIDSIPLFTELGAKLDAGNSVSGKIKLDLTIRQDWFGANKTSLVAPWNFNSIFNLILSDWRFPQESWVAVGNKNAWLAAGRFKAGIGEGHFGNTFLNSRAEWYDQVQGVVGNKNLRFMYFLSSSATHLSKEEAAIQFKEDSGTRYHWDDINDHDYTTEMEATKVFAYSELEARFWDRLRIGIGQMNLIGGKTPSLLDVLPGVFWHNAYTAGFTNVMLNVNASLVPIDGLKLFGEFTLDDIMGPDEATTSKPYQGAWQTGASYSFETVNSIIVTIGGEYTNTSEWVYCRWQPYLTMYQRHVLAGGWTATDWPLGFAYGPDAKHLGFYVDASLPSGTSLELGYEYLIKGPIYMGMIDSSGNPIYYDYDERTDITQSTTLADILNNPDQLSHGISLSATVPLPLGFEFNTRVQYWIHTNYKNVAGSSKQALLYSIGVLWRY